MGVSANKPTDEAQIRQLIDTWAEAVRVRDIDGVVANHAPDMLLFDVPPPALLRGIDAYRKSQEQFLLWLGDSGVFEISELSITAGDDAAFCHGLIRCAGTETRESEGELVVRMTVCYRKIDGQWTVVHEHHSEPAT